MLATERALRGAFQNGSISAPRRRRRAAAAAAAAVARVERDEAKKSPAAALVGAAGRVAGARGGRGQRLELGGAPADVEQPGARLAAHVARAAGAEPRAVVRRLLDREVGRPPPEALGVEEHDEPALVDAGPPPRHRRWAGDVKLAQEDAGAAAAQDPRLEDEAAPHEGVGLVGAALHRRDGERRPRLAHARPPRERVERTGSDGGAAGGGAKGGGGAGGGGRRAAVPPVRRRG